MKAGSFDFETQDVTLRGYRLPKGEVFIAVGLHRIEAAIKEGKASNIEHLIELVHSTDAIDYTYQAAKNEAEKAKSYLTQLAPSDYREALVQLIEFALARFY